MANEFQRSLAQVLASEGGYVNHPDDPGGATNKGVTQAVYNTYRNSMHIAPQSVKLIADGEVASIYRVRYWALLKCDELPAGVSYVVFDGGVNSGVSQSAKWLQRALGFAGDKVDGIVGPATIEAVKAHPDHDRLIANILALRLNMLKSLKTWPVFGKGWANRIAHVQEVGQAWASGSVGPDPAYHEGGNAKAPVSAVKPAPSSAPGEVATTVGGATAVLAQTTQQLTPFSNIQFVGEIIAALTVAGAVIALGGIAYSAYAKRKAAAIATAVNGVAA